MNLFKGDLIGLTFFGSCIAVALLIASLSTRQWVNAKAVRLKNPNGSDGRIYFGLFTGKKELNVAYGWRTYDIDVIELLNYEKDFLNYGFWLGTVIGVCGGLALSCLSAILTMVNIAASSTKFLASSSGLYIWNISSIVFSSFAIGFWLAQYFCTLQYNVLTKEDRSNDWTSKGMAELGYSFWFVIGAVIVSFLNIVTIFITTSGSESESVIPVGEEKSSGAIMLY